MIRVCWLLEWPGIRRGHSGWLLLLLQEENPLNSESPVHTCIDDGRAGESGASANNVSPLLVLSAPACRPQDQLRKQLPSREPLLWGLVDRHQDDGSMRSANGGVGAQD